MDVRDEPDSTRRPAVTAVVAGVSVVLALGLLTLAARPNAALAQLPLSEDGYYLLSVARNVAAGQGITIDGRQWTNGFQPLFAMLLVPVYAAAGGDRLASLRGVLAIHWFVHVLTAWILGAIVRTALQSRGAARARLGFWLTVFLWLGSRYVLLASYNGLETGVALLLYAAAWRLLQRGWMTGGRLWALASVLGLLVLARIDAAVFVAFLAAAQLAESGTPWRVRLSRASVLALVPLAISLPWWLYNVIGFGSLIPTSGAAQAAPFSASRVLPLAFAFLQNAVPYLQLRWIGGPLQGLTHAAILSAVLVWAARGRPSGWERSATVKAAGLLLASTLLLGLYYLGFSRAAHFYGRYLAPIMLLAVPLTATALVTVRRFQAAVLLSVVAIVGTVAAMSVAGWILQVGVARSSFLDDQLPLIEAHVPAGDAVAAFQSGTIGYFRDRVVNLDGKVNAEARRERHDRQAYLDRIGVPWYCDNQPPFFDTEGTRWTAVATRGGFSLYRRRADR